MTVGDITLTLLVIAYIPINAWAIIVYKRTKNGIFGTWLFLNALFLVFLFVIGLMKVFFYLDEHWNTPVI